MYGCRRRPIVHTLCGFSGSPYDKGGSELANWPKRPEGRGVATPLVLLLGHTFLQRTLMFYTEDKKAEGCRSVVIKRFRSRCFWGGNFRSTDVSVTNYVVVEVLHDGNRRRLTPTDPPSSLLDIRFRLWMISLWCCLAAKLTFFGRKTMVVGSGVGNKSFCGRFNSKRNSVRIWRFIELLTRIRPPSTILRRRREVCGTSNVWLVGLLFISSKSIE